jgi:hypothetical protein
MSAKRLRYILGRDPQSRDRLDQFREERTFANVLITLQVEMEKYGPGQKICNTRLADQR